MAVDTPLSDSPDDDGSHRGWRTFSVTSVGATCQGFAATSPLLALPAMTDTFAVSHAVSAWFILAYPLTCAALILAFGRLADLHDRRTLYLCGLAIFTVGSVCAGIAPAPVALILARAAQGAGAAALMSANVAMLTDAFPRRQWGVALGSHMTVSSLAQVVGPVAGGLVSDALGWRAVFLMLAPASLFGLGWGLRMLSPMPPLARTRGFDYTGAVLSMLVLGCPVLASSLGQLRGWSDSNVRILMAACVLSALLFFVVERRVRGPLVDLALFTRAKAGPAYAASFGAVFVRAGVITGMALLLQQSTGLSALQAGLVVASVAAGMMISAPIAGYWTTYVGPRLLCLTGPVLLASGVVVAFASLSLDVPRIGTVIGLILAGLGLGTFSPSNTSIILSAVTNEERGSANGLRQTLQVTGELAGSTVALAAVSHLARGSTPPPGLPLVLVGACALMVLASAVQRAP